MQNFTNTKWEGLTEEEIFLLNRKLVKSTIKRKFPNHEYFCKSHMIELDDLIQMGNIGLLNAIRTFDSSSNSSFKTYAINCISWSISSNCKRDSLRNENTQTFKLANVVSAETPCNNGESEDLTILDTIETEDNCIERAEDRILKSHVVEMLKEDKDVDEELLYIFIGILNGMTMTAIGEQLGKHRNAISQKLKTAKAQRAKNRLYKYLKNGDL